MNNCNCTFNGKGHMDENLKMIADQQDEIRELNNQNFELALKIQNLEVYIKMLQEKK